MGRSHGRAALPLPPSRTSAHAETASVDHKCSGALRTLGRVGPWGSIAMARACFGDGLWLPPFLPACPPRCMSQDGQPEAPYMNRHFCVSWFQFCGKPR